MITIPFEIVTQVPSVAGALQGQEQQVIAFYKSDGFSVAKLSEVIKEAE